MKKLTTIVTVDEIEPCLDFWTERFGFEKTAEVPEGDRLGFVILQNGAIELMYQTRASVEGDVPELVPLMTGQTNTLYAHVEEPLDDLLPRLEGLEVVVPRRTTFYGADEIFVRAPCGSVVGLAYFATGGDAA